MADGTTINTLPINIEQFTVDASSNVNIPAGSTYNINNSPIVSAEVADVTYAALATLKSTSALLKGQWYNVTDKSVILFATDVNGIALSGYYRTYNADYQHVGVYSGVLAATGISPSGSNQGVWNTSVVHTVGKMVIWGGYNWINATGALGSVSSETALSAAWTKLNPATTPTTQGYILEIDAIDYDFALDRVVKRCDKRGNGISSSSAASFNQFQWGNDLVNNNIIEGNSVLYCLNNSSTIDSNSLLSLSNIIGTRNAGLIEYNNLDSASSITVTTQVSGGAVNNNNLSSASTITATSNVGAIDSNELNSGSTITATTQGASGSISSNSLEGGATIVATSNLGIIEFNSIASGSTIAATSQAASGSTTNNSLSNESIIFSSASAGEVKGNELNSKCEIYLAGQTVDGVCDYNVFSNESGISGAGNAGNISDNAGSSKSIITATSNAGTIQNNTLSSVSEITAISMDIAGVVSGNILTSGAIIDAGTNSGAISNNTVSEFAKISATGNSGAIEKSIFQRGFNIDLSGNAASISGRTYPLSGLLYSNSTPVGTGADTTDDLLKTYTLAADSLTNVGDSVTIDYVFTTAANADNKHFIIYFDSIAVLGSAVAAYNNKTLVGRTTIVMTGTGTQDVTSFGSISNTGAVPLWSQVKVATTSDETTDLIITANGVNGTAAANDIVNIGFTVTLNKVLV